LNNIDNTIVSLLLIKDKLVQLLLEVYEYVHLLLLFLYEFVHVALFIREILRLILNEPRSIVPAIGSRRIFQEKCGKVTGSFRKALEVVGIHRKNPETSRPEYCFQLPSIFRCIPAVSRRTSFIWEVNVPEMYK
jgi:hypothetical protein